MRLSAKVHYAALAMLHLALQEGRGPSSARQIADNQDVPQKYLEQLLSSLQAAGLVSAVRGRQGGYVLARRPEEITLAHVYRAVEGAHDLRNGEQGAEAARRPEEAVLQDVWCSMYGAMYEVLERRTLAGLADDARRLGTERADMYAI